jgi:hypothetical protein
MSIFAQVSITMQGYVSKKSFDIVAIHDQDTVLKQSNFNGVYAINFDEFYEHVTLIFIANNKQVKQLHIYISEQKREADLFLDIDFNNRDYVATISYNSHYKQYELTNTSNQSYLVSLR